MECIEGTGGVCQMYWRGVEKVLEESGGGTCVEFIEGTGGYARHTGEV